MFDDSTIQEEEDVLDLASEDEEGSGEQEEEAPERSEESSDDDAELGITIVEDEEPADEEDPAEEEDEEEEAPQQVAKPARSAITPEVSALIDQTVETQFINAQGAIGFYRKDVDLATRAITEAKVAMEDAHNKGDVTALVKAQEAISRATLAHDRATTNLENSQRQFGKAVSDPEGFKKDIRDNLSSKFAAPEVAAQQAPVETKEDIARRDSWMSKNKWFDRTKATSPMTATAMAIHSHLGESGVRIGSLKYWALIDKGMQKAFPNKFNKQQQAPQKKSVAVVPAVTRTSSPQQRPNVSKNGELQFTREERAMAQRLGITDKEGLKDYHRNLQAEKQSERRGR